MNARDFVGWWNLIFVAPFILGALMVALSVLGLGGDDEGADFDGDADSADDGWLEQLHLGGIPPLMLLQNFLLWFGLCGWSANRMQGASGAAIALISVPLALVCGLILTVVTARFLARFTPEKSSAAAGQRDLEGRIGEAMATISAASGRAYVRDERGTLHQIAARTQGEEVVASGHKILVVAYEDDGRFRVKAWRD